MPILLEAPDTKAPGIHENAGDRPITLGATTSSFPSTTSLNLGANWHEVTVIGFNGTPLLRDVAIGTVRDPQAERTLPPQFSSLSALMQASPVAVLIFERSTNNIVYSNNAAAKLLGREPSLGTERITQVADEVCTGGELQALLATGKPTSSEFALKDGTGNFFQAQVIVGKLSAPGLGNDYTVLQIFDLSATQRLAEATREAAVGRSGMLVAAQVAHDLNNALAAAVMSTGLYLGDPLLPRGPIAETLELAHQSVNRAVGLVRLLVPQRGGIDQATLLHQIFLHDMVKDLAILARVSMPRNVSLHYELDPQAGLVRADSVGIQRVLDNLITNAKHAVGEKPSGEIHLRLRSRTLKKGELSGIPEGDYVQIAVEDNGCGMTPEVMGRLFEKFFTTKPAGVGTGLGLANVAEIVNDHEGYVSVDSTPGKGSTFTIFLPKLTSPLARKAPQPLIIG